MEYVWMQHPSVGTPVEVPATSVAYYQSKGWYTVAGPGNRPTPDVPVFVSPDDPTEVLTVAGVQFQPTVGGGLIVHTRDGDGNNADLDVAGAADRAEAAVVALQGTVDTIETGRLSESVLSSAFAPSDLTLIRPGDVEAMHGLLRSGQGIRWAVLGDSTEAGVGQTSATAYGEANHINQFSAQTVLALAMMMRDENFIAPDPDSYTVTDPTPGTGPSAPIPYHSLVVAAAPSFSYTKKQAGPVLRDKLSAYALVRTAEAAPKFDLTINGVTTTVDTYVAPLAYSGSVNVLPRLAKATVDIPASLSNTWTIGNLQLVNRGGTTATDGTAVLLGFAFGQGVDFRNFAVSSTTLKNDSVANTSRGITTDDRIAKAVAMSANVVSMGWGTNDAKDGVWASVEQFKAEYAARIDQLRAALPGVVIILNTDPKGLAAPYDGNPAYNQAIREVAAAKRVSCFDVERIASTVPGLYADDVHPSAIGYQALGLAAASAFGMGVPFKQPAPAGTPAKVYSGTGTPEGVLAAPPGSTYKRTSGTDFTEYTKLTGTGATGWHITSGHRSLAATNSVTPNRNTTTKVNLTLAANGTVGAPTNAVDGDYLMFVIKQDATGGRTLTWNPIYTFTDDVDLVPTAAANRVDIVNFIYDASATLWREVDRSTNQK